MYTTRTGISWQRIGLTQFRTKFRIHAYERTNDSERGGTFHRINTKWFVWQVVCVFVLLFWLEDLGFIFLQSSAVSRIELWFIFPFVWIFRDWHEMDGCIASFG
jgi:hypothetical protein